MSWLTETYPFLGALSDPQFRRDVDENTLNLLRAAPAQSAGAVMDIASMVGQGAAMSRSPFGGDLGGRSAAAGMGLLNENFVEPAQAGWLNPDALANPPGGSGWFADPDRLDADLESPSGMAAGFVTPDLWDLKSLPALLGTFGGARALTADHEMLEVARRMGDEGAGREAIMDATGWWQGADGQWRFEIPDDNLVFKDPEFVSDLVKGDEGFISMPGDLGEVIDHPELRAAYPQLFEEADETIPPTLELEHAPMPEGAMGQYPDESWFIRAGAPDTESLRSVTAHELNHAVQEIEGFARGGSPSSSMTQMAQGYRPALDAYNDRLIGLGLEGIDPTILPLMDPEDIRRAVDDSMFQMLDKLKEMHPEAPEHLLALRAENAAGEVMDAMDGTQGPFEVYQRLAGEVDSRNVQTRLDPQARAGYPWETQQHPDQEQILHQSFNGQTITGDPYNVAEMTGYHGTPHTFPPEPGFPNGRFRLDKMGSGEGAQAYGWGSYFAENKKVAQEYQPRDFEYEKVLLERYNKALEVEDYETANILEQFMLHDTPEEMLEQFPEQAQLIDEIARIPQGSSLYQLDIPDEHLGNLLDWDAPLSEQAALSEKIPQQLKELARQSNRFPGEVTPDRIERLTAGEFYQIVGRMMGEESLSNALAQHGIPGLRFLDGNSRGTGGTRNMVLWDQDFLDKNVNITHRNGGRLRPGDQ